MGVRLCNLRGHWVVLYFYPKDDTPGCTKEAGDFRDNDAALQAAWATVLGVSGDTEAAHQKFAARYELPSSSSSTTKSTAWHGRTAPGARRRTTAVRTKASRAQPFVISPQGRIASFGRRAKPGQHSADVLAWLREHASGAG